MCDMRLALCAMDCVVVSCAQARSLRVGEIRTSSEEELVNESTVGQPQRSVSRTRDHRSVALP